MNDQLEGIGFAKLKGFSFWPAKVAGQFGKRLWVKFYGTNQFGSIVNDAKHWQILSDKNILKFATPLNLKKKDYDKAVREMINVVEVVINININQRKSKD